MTFTVNPWWVIAVLSLALFGVVFVWRVTRDAARDLRAWARRDRVTPLLEDDRIVAGKCEDCWAENGGEGCDWAMCGCACHDDDALEELPPERSAGELGFIGPPPESAEVRQWRGLEARRERLALAAELEHRAAYEAMGLEYPSGLLARVREAAP